MQSSFKYCHGVHTELNEAMKWMCTYTHNIIKRTGIVGHTIQFLAGSAYKELHKSTAPYYHAGVTEIHAWASPLGMCAIGYRNSTTRRRCMLHLSVRESGRSWEAIRPVQKKFPCILRIARVGHYTKEPTDTTSNGTSPGLKEAFSINAGQKFYREVSLHRVAARRRRTSAIRKSRLFIDA